MSENDISIFTEIEGRMRSFETDDVFGMPDSPIEHVYLVQSGVVSLMVQLRSGEQIETGMVGRAVCLAHACSGAHLGLMFSSLNPLSARGR